MFFLEHHRDPWNSTNFFLGMMHSKPHSQMLWILEPMIGRLTIVTGPMFAGKTTALIKAVSMFSPNEVLVFKPSIDTRYSKENVVTHTSQSYPALLIERENPDLLSHIHTEIKAVFIDELNFFDFQILYQQIKALLSREIAVFGYGLSYDFAKNPFGATLPLSELADEVQSLVARCDGCGERNAIHSYRKGNSRKSLLIGGQELYGACCESCFGTVSEL
jgi:thymidine kinase